MKRLLAAILMLLTRAAGAVEALPPAIEAGIAAGKLPHDAVALLVLDPSDSRPLLAHNTTRPMNPGSVDKLITTFAALELLGPAYTWRTRAHAVGRMEDDVLHGDLYLVGSGDPKLTLESFWLLLRGLRARGLREIRGDLVLDRSAFAPVAGDPGRFDGEPTRPYNTLPDALLVNFKAVELRLVPDKIRRAVRVLAEPPLPEIRVDARVNLDAAACDDGYGWLGRLRDEVRADGSAVSMSLSGSFSSVCGERARSYSVLGHAQYVGSLFRLLWSELGGSLQGGVREGTVPAGAPALAEHESPPLVEVIRDINKFSNNVMARQLFLTLGTGVRGVPATTAAAAEAVRARLAMRGLPLEGLVLDNGSGLSRTGRVSAATLGALLAAAWNSPVMPEFVASMPVMAVDGTLRRYGHGKPYARRAHIKGGTLNGVRAMAGYVLAEDGRRIAVVALVNHPGISNATVTPLFDALLTWAHAGHGPRGGGQRRRHRGGENP